MWQEKAYPHVDDLSGVAQVVLVGKCKNSSVLCQHHPSLFPLLEVSTLLFKVAHFLRVFHVVCGCRLHRMTSKVIRDLRQATKTKRKARSKGSYLRGRGDAVMTKEEHGRRNSRDRNRNKEQGKNKNKKTEKKTQCGLGTRSGRFLKPTGDRRVRNNGVVENGQRVAV